MRILFGEELPYDPNQVTPGVIGFAVTALVAVAVMLLMWDFNRRVRRINDREEAKERLMAEIAAAGRPDTGAAPEPSPAVERERADAEGTARGAEPDSERPGGSAG